MHASNLDELEAALGIILPEAYRKVMRRLARKRLRGARAGLVCMDASELLEINELARSFWPVAGLEQWPEDLFVIGDDKSDSYYAIRHDVEDSSVVYFDLERDELRECAPSIEDFCKRIEASLPFDSKLLHKARVAKTALRGAVIVPDFDRKPKWASHWPSFVEAYAEIHGKDARNRATIKKVNAVFGSQPVRWTGRVSKMDLGRYPRVWAEMPGPSRFPKLEQISFGLRWAGGQRSRGFCIEKGSSPQVLTSIDDWRPIRVGDEIELLTVFAPGIRDQTPCVGPVIMEGQQIYTTSDCGGHVLRIVKKSARRKTAHRRSA